MIEPKPQSLMGGKDTGQLATTRTEKPSIKNSQIKPPGMLFGFGFLGSILLLGLFTALKKFRPVFFLRLTGKKVTIFLLIAAVLFFFLTVTAVFLNRTPDAVLLKQPDQAKPEPGKIIMNQENKPVLNEGGQESGVCGNNLCEPDLGESKEICPRDCSGNN